MVRTNINILGVSKLKWVATGKFNSDFYYVYYCGQRVEHDWATFTFTFQKNTEWSFLFQDKPFNITVIQVYAPPTDAEKAEVDQFYEDIEDLELQRK